MILQPRGLDYKVQFPGPTGTNAVEAALKLARKVTGRRHVVAFTNGFHGMTLGALAVTGNLRARAAAGVAARRRDDHAVRRLPRRAASTRWTCSRATSTDDHSGLDKPAAIIVETVQGEGGVNVAARRVAARLERLAREHGILLIVDDIQAGCGRTGTFFSFEQAGIKPDIVCLSKSISGFGLADGAHAHAARARPVGAGRAQRHVPRQQPRLRHRDRRARATGAPSELEQQVRIKAELVTERLWEMSLLRPGLRAEVRGRGLLHGLHLGVPGLAREVAMRAFDAGLVIETAGPDDGVLKLMPPLTISVDELTFGLDVIETAIDAAASATGYLREAA